MTELSAINLVDLEKDMLAMPQAEFKTSHYFGPGVYIREVVLPAGVFALGHMQKQRHLNVVISGAVAMVDGDQVRVVKAPCIFTGEPGRKCGLVLEETVWHNVYATNETDIEKLEDMFIEKSEVFKELTK